MKIILIQSLLILFLTQSFASLGQSTSKSQNTNIEIMDPESTERPLLRDSFLLDFSSFESIRLFHGLKDKRVKHINPTVEEITNLVLRNDLQELFNILNEAKIDSHYVGGMTKYDSRKELKVLFLNSNENSFRGTYPTIELFIANDGANFTIREYYYTNGANFYVLDEISTKKLIAKLEQLINTYTTFNTGIKTWTEEQETELEIEDIY